MLTKTSYSGPHDSVGNPRPRGTPPPPSVAVPLVLNTHADVFTEQSRVAGVDCGCLYNRWLKCDYSIAPAVGTSAFRWTCEFYALDDGTNQSFNGVAGNRPLAYAKILDVLTKRIGACVDGRKAWARRYNAAQLQSLAAGVPLAG